MRGVRIAGAVCLGVAASGAMAAPPAAQQLFQQPQLSAAELSPSGQHVAMRVMQKDGRQSLAVMDLKTMQATIVLAFNDGDVDDFHWVNDDRLVANQTTTLVGLGRVDVGPGLFAVQRDGTGFKPLVRTDADGFVSGQKLGRELLPWNTFFYATSPRQQSTEVFVIHPIGHDHRKEASFYGLQKLDTANGSARDVDVPLHSHGWLLDQQGRPRTAVVEEGNSRAVWWNDGNNAWVQIGQSELFAADSFEPDHLAADGRLFVVSRGNADTLSLYTYDTAARAVKPTAMLTSPGFDVDPVYIENDERLLGVRHQVDAWVTTWFDEGMKAVQARVDKALPSSVNELTPPRRPALPFVLVRAYSDTMPPTHYLFNTETGKFVKLGTTLPGLDPKALGTTDFVRYKARDGLEIPAWLTLPPGDKKQGLPMVVLAHGGPWVRGRSWGFDAQVQFLASRGYAVLQPEFRGSAGYGDKLFKAGWKQWGQAMQDDLADGVKWAVAQGYVDPKRVCIGGASYGGYATLMGLIRDPDLYRCGFEWVGVTDLNLMYDVDWSDASKVYKKYGMPRLIGDQVADAVMLKAASPLAQADRLNRPLLMAHGRYDIRVPIVHGEKLRDALKARGADVQWVVYDEGHGWRKTETQVDFWTRVEKFLDQHIGH